MSHSILLFYGNGTPFSNFSRSPFVLDGVTYCCMEQYYQMAKSMYFKDVRTSRLIMATDSPFAHKRLGGCVTGFNAARWTGVSYGCMKRGLTAKFRQNSHHRKCLIETDERLLGEASGTDFIWGIGLYETHPNARDPTRWPGDSLLGRALMEVRAELLGA